MCLYPTVIKNRRYTKTKKNGGVIPPVPDNRLLEIPVPCGICMECRAKKAREWQVRLTEEVKKNKNGIFVTLTFSDEAIALIDKEVDESAEGYTRDNLIATLAVRRFLERWRKHNKKSVKHWLVTELGTKGTENIHIHGIIWTDKGISEIKKHWKYGFIDEQRYKKNYVNEQTISYIVKYIKKMNEKHKRYVPKILTSKGIGSAYTKTYSAGKNTFKGAETKDVYVTESGHKLPLPTYYRNKIYSEQEKEKLWIQKLDEGKMWIGGEQVEANDDKNIAELLRYYRAKNKQLGYASGYKTWEQEQYDRKKRQLMHNKRLERAKKEMPAARLNKLAKASDNKAR